MRIHAAIAATCLVGTAALGGCADIPFTDDNFTLSTAASMRVEVEVYKGPLSKTRPVQWGELEGLVDTAVVLLEKSGGAICRTIARKYSRCGRGRDTRESCPSECESERIAAEIARQSDDGDAILWGMYADAQRLLDEAKKLKDAMSRIQPGSPGCQINQALATLDGPVTGPCSVSRAGAQYKTTNKAIDGVGRQLQGVKDGTNSIRDSADTAREAAATAGAHIKNAQKTIDDASILIESIVEAGDGGTQVGTNVRTQAKSVLTQVENSREFIGDAGTQVQAIGDTADIIADANANISSTARAAEITIGVVKESITGAKSHLRTALTAAENVRKAAGEADENVERARRATDAASEYVRHWTLLADARTAETLLKRQLIDMAHRLHELRAAIIEAASHTKGMEAPDLDANALQDALAETRSALHDAKLLANEIEQTDLTRTTFNQWRKALGTIDDPAKELMAREADELLPLVESSDSSTESATSTLSDIAKEAESMQANPANTIRTTAAALRRHLIAAAKGVDRHRATVASLRTEVAAIANKVDVLVAQLDKDSPPSLKGAVEELKAARTKTNKLSDAANEGISDRPWEDTFNVQVARRVGDFGVKLKATAFYWAEIHTALAPCCRDVRIAMATFTNVVAELSNHLESRADALQWQLDEEYGTNARLLPLSIYLRDAQPTDFLNLYTWNRAADWALLPDMFWHPWNAFSSDETADRVRVIERLFADHNWGKINTAYGSGQGTFAMALVKDEIGNWSLKSFEADPSKLVEAYTDLTLAALTKVRRTITGSKLPQPELLRLTGKLSAGQIGDSAGPFDVFDTERLHERVVGELTGIREDAVKTRDALAAQRVESARKVVVTETKAQSAEARAESASLNPVPTMCAAPASCPVEATLAKAREAETEALEAKISVRTMVQEPAKDAASNATTLADKAVMHVRKAEAAAAAATATASAADATAPPREGESSEQTEAATAANTDEAAKEAHLLAEKAKAYAEAAREWAAHAGAIVEREGAVAALNVHRAKVNDRIRDVLNDYAAVIATLLESRAPRADSSPEMTDGTQTDGGGNN